MTLLDGHGVKGEGRPKLPGIDCSIVLAVESGYLGVKLVLLVWGVQCRLTDIFMLCHLSFVIKCREKHPDICTVSWPLSQEAGPLAQGAGNCQNILATLTGSLPLSGEYSLMEVDIEI